MHRHHATTPIAAGWVLGLGTITWAATLAASGAWSWLIAWCLLPPLLLIGLRTRPIQPGAHAHH